MLGHGELKAFNGFDSISQSTIALRYYLQDLYRFFKICPMSKRFVDIFDYGRHLFFNHQAFTLIIKDSDIYASLAKMLFKKKRYSDLEKLLVAYHPLPDDTAFLAIAAKYHQTVGNAAKAEMYYRILSQKHPDKPSYLSGLARCSFDMEEYSEARELYSKVAAMRPDNYKAQLNLAVCMTYTEEFSSALQLLAKLYYEHTDNIDVVKAYAWAYLVSNKPEQAVKKYAEVLQKSQSLQAEDNFYMGLSLWLAGNINNAVDYFVKAFSSNPDFEEAIYKEQDLIYKYQISDIQTRILLDLIRQRLHDNNN